MIVKATKYGKIWIPTFNKEDPQSVKAVHIADNSVFSKETEAPDIVIWVKIGKETPTIAADINLPNFFMFNKLITKSYKNILKIKI